MWAASCKRRSGLRRMPVLVAVLVAVLGLPLDAPRTEGTVAAAATASSARSVAPSSPAGRPDVLPPDEQWTVTLLTGEVVAVRSDADGRATASLVDHATPVRMVQRPDGDLYVIPFAVLPLLDRVLDPALFNVTGLVRQGYDDAASDVVPLIVQGTASADGPVTPFAHSEHERQLPSIGAVALDIPKDDSAAVGEQIADLGAGPRAGRASLGDATRIWLDQQTTALPMPPADRGPVPRPRQLDRNLVQIGADDAWAAGLTGEGVRVAVLDTGIDARHPDLVGQVVAEENFSAGADADTVDRHGHGTYVASLVAGTGAAARGARSGVAPDADLIVAKVLDDHGSGTMSSVIAGMEWAAPQADVVNMSLSADVPSDGSDPVSLALDQLSEQHDALFVVSAGNRGPVSTTIGIPGAADRALTVGAVDGTDELATFSSRGPLAGSFELKPNVVAPGVDIVAARAAGTAGGAPEDGDYTAMSGTSMAAPQVAGAAAILAQQHPGWTGDQLRNALIGSAHPLDADGYDVGAGRIDLGAGIRGSVLADHDVVDMAIAHPRTEPHAEVLTWTNTGEAPQTLHLAAELGDRDGDAVDEVAVEPAELAIAPGASASATLLVDGPDVDGGLYSGAVTATAGTGPAGRTPIAVHAGPEMVDLTIEATAPGGADDTPPRVGYDVVNLDDFTTFYDSGGFSGESLTLQVPAGRYAVVGGVGTGDLDDFTVAQVGDPDVTVDGPTTVAFDGSSAEPLHPTVEGVDAAPPMYSQADLLVTPSAGTGGFPLMASVQARYPMLPVHLTPMAADPEHFAARQIFRLQALPFVAHAGTTPVEIVAVPGGEDLAEGEHVRTAVDAGDGSDGSDFAGAQGRLALVQLPPVDAMRAVIDRATAAGAEMLAFVDEGRSRLTFGTISHLRWTEIPVLAAGGDSAAALRAAAVTGEDVTLAVTASPYVYDIVTPETAEVVPEMVIDEAEQARLATLRERFHHDPGSPTATGDTRWPNSVFPMNLESVGPLRDRRTAHVSPDVDWQAAVRGPAVSDDGSGPAPDRMNSLSLGDNHAYASGSQHTVRWLRRPQWPAPVQVPDGPSGWSMCGFPTTRTTDTLFVDLSLHDAPDQRTCVPPVAGTVTLERDGAPIGSTTDPLPAAFDIPSDPGTYRLTYDLESQAPYTHRSTTTWTFSSSAPDDPTAETPVSLLTVGYRLPLDVRNQLTSRQATLSLRHVPAVEHPSPQRPDVWTSTDDGATWQAAPVQRKGGGVYAVTLPDVDAGTGVALRVDARDRSGNRVQQTLFDAWFG